MFYLFMFPVVSGDVTPRCHDPEACDCTSNMANQSDSESDISSSSSSSSDENYNVEDENGGQIHPYSFEPRFAANERANIERQGLEEDQDENHRERLQNLDWYVFNLLYVSILLI